MLSRDAEREVEIREDQFKSSVFANDPQLYQEMFGKNNTEVVDEEEIEHVVIDSDEDFNKLMRELKQLGVIE
jgi:hypothetical protein